MVPGAGIEPARLAAGDFESPASTNFTTRARAWKKKLWHSALHELSDDRRRDWQDAFGGAAAHRRRHDARAWQRGAGQAGRQQPRRLGEGPPGAVDDPARRGTR